jgi:hypothetical protein
MGERHTVSAATVLGAITAAALVAGCGSDDKPKVGAPEAQVRTVVQRFATASAAKDYQAICDRLIARSLAANVEQFGLPCEIAFKQGLENVRGARLRIDGVRVSGTTAFVDVHSTAAGQPPSDDTLKLVRGAKGWQIVSLSAGAGPQSEQPSKP